MKNNYLIGVSALRSWYAFFVIALVTTAFRASGQTVTVSALGSASGWYSDDTRTAAGVTLNGTNSSYQPYFAYTGAPTPSTTNDSLIALQIKFGNYYTGSDNNNGVLQLDGTTANLGKSSVKFFTGGAISSGASLSSFTSTFRWYMDPYTTNRTPALSLLVLGSNGLTYSLAYVGEGSAPGWNTFAVTASSTPVDPANYGWRIYGNGAPGGTVPGRSLNDVLADATYGSILTGGSVVAQGFNIGSYQRFCRVGIDWLESSILNSGNRIDFITPPAIWYVNDNSTSGDVYTTAVGAAGNPGTAAAPFPTIAEAITAASAGDMIRVDAGTYTESLTINKAVSLRGPNHTVAWNGTRVAEASVDGNIVLSAANASFSGFEVNRTYLPALNWLMEVLQGGTTVSNNIIKIGTVQTSTQQGFIRLNTSSGTVNFTGNEFKMATPGSFPANTGINGLLTQGSGTYTITGNRIAVSGGPTQDADAVGITGGTVLFDGNIVNGDIMGGVTAYGDFGNVTITNNVISNYTAQLAGIRVVGCCGFNPANGFATITGNTVGSTISGTTGIGIIMMPAANILGLSNNDLAGNSVAVSHTSGSGTLSATCNWWGLASGPAAGQVSGAVTTIPYLTSSNLAGACIGGLTVQNSTQNTWYATIQAAINAATAGDVIEAGAATYNETVTIDKALTVRGPNHAVAGSGTRAAEAIVTGGFVMNGVSNVTISGFSVTGNNTPGSRGVLLGNTGTVAGPVTISNNIIENWTTSISLAGGATYPWVSNVTVSGNLIRNNTAGIGSTENVAGLTVSNNTFSGNAEGIGLGPGLTGLSVSGNTFASSNSSHIADYGSGTMPAYSTLFATNTFGNAAAVSATNGNDYTSKSIYNTISAAVSNAAVGATIDVTAGTYAESITVDKRLTLDGAGATTIINTSTIGTKAITVTASGSSASSRLVIKDMAFTGPSNTGGSDAISFEPASAGAYVTVENVTVSGHGQAVHFRSGTMSDAQILNSTLNGNGFGVRVASAVTSMDGMLIDGCTMNNNNSSAISTNPSGTLTNVNTYFTISNCTFSNNSTAGVANQHDLSFFAFSGNAALSNITLTSGNGTAANSNSYGIVFTRGSGSGPLGTVSLNNVTVQGHVGKGALTFQKYSDISNVSLNNVSLNNCVAPWGSLILDHTDADAFNAGNTSLRSIALWNSGGATATSVNYYHATSNILLDRSIPANCFQMEDQTAHKVDVSALGFVSVKSGELFVTTNSFASPTTTSPNIQRAVDAASAGDIVNIAAGTYTHSSQISIAKNLTLQGESSSTTIVRAAYSGTTSGDGRGFILVNPGHTVNFKRFKVDVPGYNMWQGIRHRGTGGLIDEMAFENIQSVPLGGAGAAYQGLAIAVFGNVTVSNNTFTNIGRVGTIFFGAACTNGQFIGNTYTGKGVGDFLDYAVEVGGGAVATISNNVISGNLGVASVDGSTSAGILLGTLYGAGTSASINNNSITGNTTGILQSMVDPSAASLTASNNDFSGNDKAIQCLGTPAATCNWYGTTNANTIASKFIGTVTFSPWLDSGTDGSASIGFQPSGACTGTAPAIASTVTNVSCFGLANGAIDITVSGGSAPYSYAWNGGSTDADRTALVAGSYTVTVTDANGSTVSSTITVTQPAPPSAAGTISGINEDCRTGVAASEPFSVPASTNATTYTWSWTGSSGVTISNNGSRNITLDYTATAIQGGVIGTLTVTPSDVCGNTSTSSSVAVEYQGASPVTPASISGDGKMCPGDVKTFSIAAVSRATSYNWTVPANTTISSGAGTNIITVTVAAGYTGGEITVSAENVCGVSPVRTKAVTSNLVASPGTITGLSTGMCGESGVSYSIAAVTGATAYTWSVTGGTIVSGQNTTAITVNWSLAGTSGSISVTSGNACGTSSARTLTVTKTPARPNVITGVTTPACTSSVANASVATVTGATSYTWAITSGGSITGGQGTKEAQVTWGTSLVSSQSITARASNSCGNSLTRALTGISVVACSRDQAAGSSDLQMLVYPNPAHDWMMLNFSSDSEQRYQVRLTDMSGRAVLVQDGTSDAGANQLQLTPGSISSGVYMLQLTIDGKHAVQRIVIE